MSIRRHWAIAIVALALLNCSAPAGGMAPAPSAAPPPSSTAGAAAATPAAPAPAAREPGKLAITALALSISPAAVADELGYWREEGIEPELPYIAGAAQPAQALVAGDVQFVAGAGATAVPASLEGADLVVIAVSVPTYPFTIQSQRLERLEQLRGGKLGVTRRGAASDFAARYALQKVRLVADRDVPIIQMGGEPEAIAAVENGAADAAVVSEFGTVEARHRGFHELVDISKSGAPYSLTGLVTSRKLINERPDFVRRFVRGWVRGLATAATNPDVALPIMKRFIKADDDERLREAYDLFSAYVARIPYPQPEGVQAVIDTLAQDNPRAANVKAADFIDDRFIRELDQSGFFKQLYGE
ncbi:MAG TPA: ABC transporter substrate-binding protein [Chloroflexota bacterium]|nr:ABC transporter substrate-binding protein [Chloroflexota bacterium]